MRYVLIGVALSLVTAAWVHLFHKSRMDKEKSGVAREAGDRYARRRYDEANRNRWTWTVVLTIALAWASWSWGMQGIKEDNAQEIASREWFSTFNSRHQARWNEICRAIFTYDFAEGILYQNGQAYTLDWCYSLWSPPEAPSSFSESDYQQPERQPPFAGAVVFDAGDGSGTFCTSATSEESCFYFEDVFPPRPPDQGW